MIKLLFLSLGILGLLFLSISVAAVIADLGLLVSLFTDRPVYVVLGDIAWATSNDFLLLSIPFFVLLGEILLQTGLAEKTYYALNKWLSWLPGGLMHANIATSALFAATSGSSVATAATITTIAMPEAKKYRYNIKLFTGSIAAGGTLGILIPPSINLIIYGFLTNTSVPKLFIAGIFPGIILALLFMIFILIASLFDRKNILQAEKYSWSERLKTLLDLIPILVIFVLILGSIYFGLATPTEAAALGVSVTLILAAIYKKLTWQIILKALKNTMKVTAMIMLILIAANFLNFVFVSIGLIDQFRTAIENLNFSPLVTLLIIILVYVLLGFFVETLSLMVLTIPIVAPVIFSLGYDPVWFGILIILLIEMALITPPVGLNLYVVQGVRQEGSIVDIIIGSIPFVILMFLMIIMLIIFPQIALYLTTL